ncbi:MAG: RHS repeat-associated core domain-containing protein, partial [Fimbriimonadales bacterium]
GHPEDETGLIYMRARYYEPATGRFINEDPARDGVNWYLYADGNPVGKVDRNGKDSQEESLWTIFGYFFATMAVIYSTAGFKLLMDEFVFFAYAQVASGVFAILAVYSFFRALGGSKSEWTLIGFAAGTLWARGVYSYFDDILKSIESFGKLGKAFGVFGLSAASAAAGYTLAVSAALLLTEAVE